MFNNTLRNSLSKLGVTALFLSLGISMVAFNATADTSETKVQTKTMSSDWVRPSDAELKKVLTKLQFDVTRKDKTERPFSNEYWDNKQDGIYVDIISGEPLFSSKHKFKSGTGWPSFTHPLIDHNIVEKDDFSLFGKRIEVRSKNADSHLGHVFNDGPGANGLRYCINSASLRFIPKEKLKAEGYEQYVGTFK